MDDTVYREMLPVMQKRGGPYAGLDIPEFFAMAKALFTPEQAAVNNILPTEPTTAERAAEIMGRGKLEIEGILESMADNGLCFAHNRDGVIYYNSIPFMIGIFEFQFMRGTATERDEKNARAIDAYKRAFDSIRPRSERKPAFPGLRVIPVDRVIENKNAVRTYHQVKHYIETSDLISVATCYCRQEALLLGRDLHDIPLDVCMGFGSGADFYIDRLGGRKVSKEEAMAVLDRAEDAGLIHMTRNVVDTNFICNCDRWHCEAVKSMLAQPKPGAFFNSGFEPLFDPDMCVACEVCIERCPAEALTMSENDLPVVDLDRCFGCAVCATGCTSDAISMGPKEGYPEPPRDSAALAAAFKARRETTAT